MVEKQNAWKAPKIVILMRNFPEEALQQTVTCKIGNNSIYNPNTLNNCAPGQGCERQANS